MRLQQPAQPASARSVRAPLSLVVDPAFSASSLGSDPSLWYSRLLGGMSASSTLADNIMLSGDSYTTGRDGGNYVEALLMALRATGDRQFLDRVYTLTEEARTKLRDPWLNGTTDGYSAWLWLADSTNATYYGKDTNWLDESITSGNVALWAYAFQLNRGVDPKFATAADFWKGWLETQFLAKWYHRANGDSLGAWNTPYLAFYKPDVEPRSANWRLAYYMWKLTGNAFYKSRTDEIVAQLTAAQVSNPSHPGAFRWAQQLDPSTQIWMATNYANYYIRVAIEMNLENQSYFSSPATMKAFAATFRDVVYPGSLPGLTTMTHAVNGGGSTGYALYAFNGLAAWDSTGALMNLANLSITGVGHYASGGLSKAARNDVYMSGYALAALAIKQAVSLEVEGMAPDPARLASSVPNPFTGSTQIRFTLPRAGRVRVTILDANGRALNVLEQGGLTAGPWTCDWDGRDRAGAETPPGMYLALVESGTQRVVVRLTRLR